MKLTIIQQRLLISSCIAIAYFLVALVALEFATTEGNASLIWPSSGIALAALLKFGRIHVMGVFIGALAAGIYVNNPLSTNILIALGNSLEPLIAITLLQRLPFSSNMYHKHDYIYLIFAGGVGAIVSTIFGTSALLLAGYISLTEFTVIINWWMGDSIGILLITPFLLLFSYSQLRFSLNSRAVELAILLIISTLLACFILAGWDIGLLNQFKGSYLLTIPLAWAILRFSQTITSFIVFEYFCIAVWGILHQQGLFITDELQISLLTLWVYFTVIALVSMFVTYLANERNTLFQAINNSQTESYIFCENDLRFEFVNHAALKNLGVNSIEALSMTPMDLKPLYSKQMFRKLLQPLFENTQSFVTFETVHERKDHSLYPVEIHVQRVDESNRRCYLATVIDISERIEKEKHRILGNHVCELSPQAIMITNKDNRIIRVNSAFTSITGYMPEDVMGQNPNILQSGRHDKTFYKQLWHAIQSKGSWTGEIYNRRKDGELYLQNLTIKVLHDAIGDTENHIAMFTDITHERQYNQQLKYLSEHDVLTGLPNRILLQQEFEFSLATAKRNGKMLGLLYLDLNNFKPVNDQFGHLYGDELLQVLAGRMQSCIRETDMVARIGGDEFIVLVSDVENVQACQTLAGKLKDIVDKEVVVKEIPLHVTASIGIALYPEQGDDLNLLLSTADKAMYADKEQMKHTD